MHGLPAHIHFKTELLDHFRFLKEKQTFETFIYLFKETFIP